MDDPQTKQHTDVVAPQTSPVTPNVQDVSATQPQPPIPAPPVVQTVATPGQPVAPVSTGHKEAAPMLQSVDIKPSDHTELVPNVDQELKEAGVEHTPQVEHPKLTAEDKKAGIEVAKAAVPVSSVTGSKVKLPFTEEKVEEIRKTTSLKDSLRWFAEEVLREIKKTHEKLTKKESES